MSNTPSVVGGFQFPSKGPNHGFHLEPQPSGSVRPGLEAQKLMITASAPSGWDFQAALARVRGFCLGRGGSTGTAQGAAEAVVSEFRAPALDGFFEAARAGEIQCPVIGQVKRVGEWKCKHTISAIQAVMRQDISCRSNALRSLNILFCKACAVPGSDQASQLGIDLSQLVNISQPSANIVTDEHADCPMFDFRLRLNQYCCFSHLALFPGCGSADQRRLCGQSSLCGHTSRMCKHSESNKFPPRVKQKLEGFADEV